MKHIIRAGLLLLSIVTPALAGQPTVSKAECDAAIAGLVARTGAALITRDAQFVNFKGRFGPVTMTCFLKPLEVELSFLGYPTPDFFEYAGSIGAALTNARKGDILEAAMRCQQHSLRAQQVAELDVRGAHLFCNASGGVDPDFSLTISANRRK